MKDVDVSHGDSYCRPHTFAPFLIAFHSSFYNSEKGIRERLGNSKRRLSGRGDFIILEIISEVEQIRYNCSSRSKNILFFSKQILCFFIVYSDHFLRTSKNVNNFIVIFRQQNSLLYSMYAWCWCKDWIYTNLNTY